LKGEWLVQLRCGDAMTSSVTITPLVEKNLEENCTAGDNDLDSILLPAEIIDKC